MYVSAIPCIMSTLRGEPEAGSPNYSDEDAELVRTRVQENCATWLVQVDDHGWLKVVCLVKVESASEAETAARDHIWMALFPLKRRPLSYRSSQAGQMHAGVSAATAEGPTT